MNEQIMFTVFYNPITKDIYRNPEGDVYDISILSDEDRKLYEELSKEGYILKDVTEYGIGYTLSYKDTFCCCDRCGKLFLQSDLSFTDKGAPYCSKCYDLIVSRGDYEGLPCPMYAFEFDDDQMSKLAEKIYQMLNSQYGYTDRELEKYFNDQTANIDEDLDNAFWKEMEEIAVQMDAIL